MATFPRPKQRDDDLYARRIIRDGDRIPIESRCTCCGAVIVGSVTES